MTPDIADHHDEGLIHDLKRLTTQRLGRRQSIRWLASAGTFALLGCGGSESETSSSSSTTTTSGTTTTTTGDAGVAHQTDVVGHDKADRTAP